MLSTTSHRPYFSNFVNKLSIYGNDSNKIEFNEHALIGVSPFNSYFSQENIEKIISWSLKNFKNIHVFIPDEIYMYTFQALGYTEQKARRKTKKQDNYLLNKVLKALLNFELTQSEIDKKIILLSHLKNQKKYLDVYNNFLKLFDDDKYFREGCISTSEWVLKGKGIPNNVINNDVINVAVKYFLSELPLFVDTPNILNVSSSFFVYKDIPKFLEDIYSEKVFIAQNQGFLQLKLHN